MIDLSKYLFKHVEVEDTNGTFYAGYVDMFESSIDNDSDEDSIGIITDSALKRGVELYQSEIKSIKIA